MTDNTQPEALRLVEQYDYGEPATYGNAWKAAVCTELLRQHARIAELEATSEAVLGGVYAELPDPAHRGPDGTGSYFDSFTMSQLRDFADRTHALRMEQAAPKAAPGEPTQEMVDAVMSLVDLEMGDPEDHRYDDGSKLAAQICRAVLALAPQQEAQPNYVVSLVVLKGIPTGFNTQNKLYAVNAASSDEAVSKAVLQMPNDFPEHRLHTACFVAIPAQPAPQPAPACHHRPPCAECAAIAAQEGKA